MANRVRFGTPHDRKAAVAEERKVAQSIHAGGWDEDVGEDPPDPLDEQSRLTLVANLEPELHGQGGDQDAFSGNQWSFEPESRYACLDPTPSTGDGSAW